MSVATPSSGEEPILAELAAAGFEVRSLTDLRHSGVRYRRRRAVRPVPLCRLPAVGLWCLPSVRARRHWFGAAGTALARLVWLVDQGRWCIDDGGMKRTCSLGRSG